MKLRVTNSDLIEYGCTICPEEVIYIFSLDNFVKNKSITEKGKLLIWEGLHKQLNTDKMKLLAQKELQDKNDKI